MKTGTKELANNSIGNALRYFWKPQSYMPSWSKSVKDKKETEDIMPKLLRKYGAYVFEYALADNKRREEIPNIQKLKEDILRNYNDVKEANGDFYKVLTLLRKSALNVEIIAQVIPNDVTVANFQQIRNNYAQLRQQQQTFLDEATKKIPYILKYWNVSSREDDINQSLYSQMEVIIDNLQNLNTNEIITSDIENSNIVKRFLQQAQTTIEKPILNQIVPNINDAFKNNNNKAVEQYSDVFFKRLTYAGMVNSLVEHQNIAPDNIAQYMVDFINKLGQYWENYYSKDEVVTTIKKNYNNTRLEFANELAEMVQKQKNDGYRDFDTNQALKMLESFNKLLNK